ncbi:TPA: morphogenetic protein [Klebsiella pneumoniae]
MKERGMIFNGEMVRAILDGRKTQTRRVMKVQPESNQLGLLLITDSTKRSDISKYHWAESNATGNHVRSKLFSCPFGAVGDRIWVRETWSSDFANYYPNDRVWYAADNNRQLDIEVVDGVRGIYSPESDVHVPFRWQPSIHMPRWASRILLEITDVRVERLNAISQEDAQSEGLELTGWRPTYSDPDSGGEVMTPYDNFAELWSSIYGDESWQANPWVWVIEFKRVEGGAA